MSESLRAYTKAVYAFERALKDGLLATEGALFTRSAPCDGWTGLDVYEHNLGNLAMIESFARTGRGPDRPAHAADDPIPQWERQRDRTLEALDHDDVLTAIAHEPFGPELGSFPVDVLVGFMAADMTVHVWDMARTGGVDERLDPALVKFANVTWRSVADDVLRGPGMMGARVASPPGSDTQTRLLNFLGRTV